MEDIILYNELQELISSMEVPKFRRDDINWLIKNLPIKNSDKHGFNRAMELIKYFKLKFEEDINA